MFLFTCVHVCVRLCVFVCVASLHVSGGGGGKSGKALEILFIEIHI